MITGQCIVLACLLKDGQVANVAGKVEAQRISFEICSVILGTVPLSLLASPASAGLATCKQQLTVTDALIPMRSQDGVHQRQPVCQHLEVTTTHNAVPGLWHIV